MAGKKKSELGTQNTIETAQAPAAVEAEACPTFTLRADRKPDILLMVALLRFSREFGVENLGEFEATVREFELYEEKHLR